MDKKKNAPFLKLVPANIHTFESSDQEDQESQSSDDSISSENDKTKDHDPIIEMLGDSKIETTLKNNQFAQVTQDDESSQDDQFALISQDPFIKKLKNSKTIKNDVKKQVENVTEPKTKPHEEKTKKKPISPDTKKSKKALPINDKKQRKIFEFGSVTNLPKEDPDEFYETIQKIYTYFNNKKSIPLILSVIHQSAGNICEAVYRLASNAYDYNEDNIDFNYSSICSVPADLAKYFI